MNCWKSYCIQNYQQINQLIEEKKVCELNPTYDILCDTSKQRAYAEI